ncbi:manganese catalase family protein [uncultured Mucilaginibacter sp.]|uniref:manganese catalase family protein n=1 Tax=uncultured Mucilaginibacter sp. TaxID=797541 RepID=UPI002629ED1E|nr:manganese catalase family protein [uncultured Mucilaginibacter sp.]
MFYHDKKLQYQVRVEKPNPAYAKLLQQAIGGIEGEIRVCLQYLFQAWGSRGETKYRDMLLETGTEEISHIEMLSTAVALNLEGATKDLKDQIAGSNPIVGSIMGGMDPRHILSAGLSAMAVDSNGVPFNGSWVVGSGNIVADMYANVMAETTGRVLATRLWELTDDPGMKDMLAFLIARDTMHQNQWLAVIEDLGGVKNNLPVPNSFPMMEEVRAFEYAFISTDINKPQPPNARWASGPSIDGKGEFSFVYASPMGQEPKLGPPDLQGHAQTQQVKGAVADKSILENIKDTLLP